MLRKAAIATAVTLLAGLTLHGCGGSGSSVELVPVSGNVTLDGQPLEGAIVRFEPINVEEGRSSFGTTDAQGHYELQYTRDKMGAVPGQHAVRFSKLDSSEQETLPPEFNSSSKHTAEVAPGGDPINFDLTSK